ncbi:MAG: cellulase family glycosylhydrolase [Chloroflexota bacterium]
MSIKIPLARVLVPLLLAALACNAPGAVLSPATGDIGAAQPPAEGPSPPAPSPMPEHRIGVRMVDGESEFYDRVTGARFVPRGANLWRWKFWPRGDEQILIDTMFNTQIGQLDSALAELPRMHGDGFNVVRVWENACWGGAPGCMDRASGGLDPAYMKNLARFLQVAKDNGIYVMLTLDELPDTGGYRSSFNTFGGQFVEFNLQFMTQGGIEAQRRYYADFIQGLRDVGAPTDAIFAYELHNEAFFQADKPPLSAASGQVTAANGQTYDLADPAQRRALMEDSWVYYIDQVSPAIKALDPTALVTMGFFIQQEPNPALVGDPRRVYLHRVLNDSALDFVDLHGYPGYDLNMRQHAENFDIIGYNKKPLVLGEFGADRHVFPDAQKAAIALQAWQAESCEFGFDGWLMWTWGGAEMPDDYWEAVQADGAIRGALSPILHPDPCVNVLGG